MTQVSRKASLALLIIVMIGLGTVSAHTATHASADLLTCDLCPGQGNPSYAIPPALSLSLPPQTGLVAAHDAPLTYIAAPRLSFRQRAPPVTH